MAIDTAAVATAYIPDLHHFRGSFGGADVVPLWRDNTATVPNVTVGLCEVLSRHFEFDIEPTDIYCYSYAMLCNIAYVNKFSEELAISAPRVPITKDYLLFRQVVDAGREMIWLHTFGERLVPSGASVGRLPRGSALCTVGVSTRDDSYPTQFSYDRALGILRVGDGQFAPVAPEIWAFSISGLEIVSSWLSYRMSGGAGRRSSPLDAVRPRVWTAQLTEELLQLLWLLEATIQRLPRLTHLMNQVLESDIFTIDDLPAPTTDQRNSPTPGLRATAVQPGLPEF